MSYGNTKRVVVIRDIPSNMIEEAILILKQEPSAVVDGKKQKAAGRSSGDDGYLLKEAELVINNYIKDNKLYSGKADSLKLAIKSGLDRRFIINVVINAAMFGSIILLGFLLIKLF